MNLKKINKNSSNNDKGTLILDGQTIFILLNQKLYFYATGLFDDNE